MGNPVEETACDGITLIQHSSLAESITSSDRQDLMITSMNIIMCLIRVLTFVLLVKVFLMQWNEKLVRDALSCGMCDNRPINVMMLDHMITVSSKAAGITRL